MAQKRDKATEVMIVVFLVVTIGFGFYLHHQKEMREYNDLMRKKAVTNNLRMITSGGQQYMIEESVTMVTYPQLVGDYFDPIISVFGEDYTGLVVYESGGALRVSLPEGGEVAFTYGSP